MKRRPVKLAVFLLLLLVGGAIVNVAVAWALSLSVTSLPFLGYSAFSDVEGKSIWTKYGASASPPFPISPLSWSHPNGPSNEGPVAKFCSMTRARRFGVVQDVVTLGETNVTSVGPPALMQSERWIVSEMRAGFPCFCVSMGMFHMSSTGTTKTWHAVVRTASVPPPPFLFNLVQIPDLSVLPYQVIWPGFALNSIVFAIVLWLLCIVPAMIRGFWRKSEGRCARCGYNLKENGVRPARYLLSRGCPECGWNRKEAAN